MADVTKIGYAGKILRVNLSEEKTWTEDLDEATVRKWVGGAGLGAKYLYEEVPPGVKWSDPENRLIWTTGPLAGTGVAGAATINIMAKGPMTHLAGSSQANGFFGAYLKFCGYDGIVFQGKAPKLVYLLLRGGSVEIRDAGHIKGKTVGEVEEILKKELGVGKYGASVFGIGPAGENRVRHACITGDYGHAAAHNGLGAVMGAKNLKAVVALKAEAAFGVFDPELLKIKAAEMVDYAKTTRIYQWGTGGGLSATYNLGALPVKNYTTNIYQEHEKMNGQYMRTHFKVRSRPCYKCAVAHVKEVTVTEGPYKGFVGEEPEYEMLAAWGPQIGNTDIGATVMLANEVDTLGMDCNETGWIIGWAMECFEKGVFTPKETDGLDLTWGNVEAVKTLMNRIARREGAFGDLLAEGVMRASKKIGGKAAEWAVYTQKGSAPRGHDHRGRGRWFELFDTCLTNTSTLEATHGPIQPKLVDLEDPSDYFSHEQVSTFNARHNGIGLYHDCTGTCRFVAADPKRLIACFNAATGWNWELADAFTLGRRIVNLLRIFNLRHGLDIKFERPSARYGSVPVDGPNKGVDIMAKWDAMVKNYYTLMGWDPQTGVPLPGTLEKLGLKELIKDL
ncbi:MAG: aldehyde ferredoxin oxidoreductase C-terminal domain-containing protein [Thermodesulfobacteriota bacterium]